MNLVVLNEDKQNYEPDDEQITSYGIYLGLSFPQDDKFKPILYDALKAPLPDDWEACQNLDQEDSLVFRNKLTQQVQETHPLDNYYRQKIMKLKGLTQNIETIAQERESWMKDSSSLYKKSKDSAEYQAYTQGKENFMSEIQQERSMYMEQDEKFSGRQVVVNRALKTPRTYTRRKKQVNKAEEIRQQMMGYLGGSRISALDIKLNRNLLVKTVKQKQKLDELLNINKQIEFRKAELASLQIQRRRKLAYLQSLKNQVKIMQS